MLKSFNSSQYKNKGINLQGAKVVQDAIYIYEKSGFNLKSMLFPYFKTEKLF